MADVDPTDFFKKQSISAGQSKPSPLTRASCSYCTVGRRVASGGGHYSEQEWEGGRGGGRGGWTPMKLYYEIITW